jgi:outer membrane phospholipase A
MPSYNIEITDEFYKSFKINITLPLLRIDPTGGTWRALETGFIKENQGTTQREKSKSGWNSTHLLIVSPENEWGIKLNDWDNYISVNDEGTGFIQQPWVTGLRPGRISWAIVS